MATGISGVLYLIVPAAVFGWFFRRFGFVDVAGFVIGGVLSYFLLNLLGVQVEEIYGYTEPLQLIGLILFFFEVGVTLNIRGVVRSSYIVASSELVLLVLAWAVTGIVAHFLGLGVFEQLILFLLMLNSSTIVAVALQKVNIGNDIYERAILQTSLEDLLQFVLFGTLIVASPLQAEPLNLLLNLLRTAGSVLVLFLAAKYTSMLLSRSPLTRSRVDKFFTLISLAILFSTLASLLGLLELFGAFIAGLAASLYFKLDDVVDLISGVKDLGLLLYFASIGLLIAPWLIRVESSLITAMLIFTIAAVLVRIVGCSIGFIISGMDVYSSTVTSLVLSSISESGIVFTYILFKAGIVGRELVVLVILSVLVTMVTSSVMIPRSQFMAAWVESRLPHNFVSSLNLFSKIYHRRVELFIRVLSLLTWFSAASLIVTSATNLIVEAIVTLGATTTVASLVVAFSIVVLLLLHTVFVRRISNAVLEYIGESRRPRPIMVLEVAVDLLMGALAVILQVYLFSDFVIRQAHGLPFTETAVVYIAAIVAIAVTAYNLLYYLRLFKRS